MQVKYDVRRNTFRTLHFKILKCRLTYGSERLWMKIKPTNYIINNLSLQTNGITFENRLSISQNINTFDKQYFFLISLFSWRPHRSTFSYDCLLNHPSYTFFPRLNNIFHFS